MLTAVARNATRRTLRLAGTRTYAQLPKSNLPSLDFAPEAEQSTGAKSSKDSLSSVEIRRRRMGRVALAILALGTGLNIAYMGREWDETELKAKKLTLENAPTTRWGRTKERFGDIFDYFNKPAWPELLPSPMPPPHQKPFTLLISIDDLLVTSTWDRQYGWRTAKRPGVDYFLGYLSQFYEVVVFTTQNFYVGPSRVGIVQTISCFLDCRAHTEQTRPDLSYLNRPLNTVISLDTDPEHVSTHPENAIILPKWNGDPNDQGLIKIIPFLESIGIYKPPDVRPILAAYSGKDIPLEYAKKEAEAKALHVEKWTKERPHGLGVSVFSSLLGLSQDKSRSQVPLTYLEQKRREAQQLYADEQQYIRENKDYFESLLKKEQEMMAKEVPGTLWEAIGQLTGEPKKPSENPQQESSGKSGTS
ncbi:NIF-domain-containing protein [Mycena pura]|uniref:Mitochondrial import inner membrane translocase subunit TIM50 n=1 Tax=Mycena pura TaxID=153505 RepID=A0AAD6YN82_9AGAR|nr:NIF-domain-containing protein [Mycena pura]